MTVLLGIDIGTSGVKSILVTPEGTVVARSVAEYPLFSPQPMWSEQNPEDWWSAVCATIRSVLMQSGVSPADIVGIGLSGQMHGAVFLDEYHTVIRPAILWNDQRTQSECDWITERVGEKRLVELTCNPVLTGFQAPKIVWLRNHEPEAFSKIRHVLLPKDFVRLRLTGELATEVSDASGTALFDVRNRCWSGEVLDACEIPSSWLPRCYESPEVSGRIDESASAVTGLLVGTPVVGGGGDQAAGAVGNGIVRSGIISSTVGTSGVVFAHSDSPRVDPKLRLHTFCHAVPGAWHLMGVMLSAGGSLQWYRDTFCQPERVVANALGIDPYEIICSEAENAPIGSEGLLFLPYLTGERAPHPDPYARGVFFGITRRSDRRHFARAVLEGVAFGLRDSFEIMRDLGIQMDEVRASGGGARSAFWRQIQADITGCSHVMINVDEGPALGAALLAGVGAKVFPSVESACEQVIRVTTSTPSIEANRRQYEPYYHVYKTLYPALRDKFSEIANI